MPKIKDTSPRTRTPLSSPDYEKVDTEGTTWDDSKTWDSANWTWGGGELIRNINKPN